MARFHHYLYIALLRTAAALHLLHRQARILVIHLIPTFRCFACRRRYERYRWLSTIFTRLGSYYALSYFCSYFKAPSPTYFMLMLALMVKSPLVHLVIMSVHHRLEFRYHVPVQIAAFLLGATWIPPFCRSCAAQPAILTKFEEVRLLLTEHASAH